MGERTWPHLLNALLRADELSTADTAWAMDEIMTGAAAPSQIAAFAVALRAKGETPAELAGLVEAMLGRSVEVVLPEELRRTALAHLRNGMSVEATAEALYIHPNTVRYRIGRVEDRLGERLAARATILEVCLTWLEVYDIDVLEGP